MPQKGFTAIVNGLHIHAMRRTSTHDVQALQSEAQFYHVYRRDGRDGLTLLEKSLSFDSAMDYCLAPRTLH
ncbi:hypothetical protein [Cupriavidus pauculus]|uniref:Uncharacterized protein n=1 Tax=Cupriavidus pauculus TaxID=82633 RepID=A0A3G8H9A6_9BURK|nr:hypothetical protein [Cupriavidus pauculus]AZG17073.1 hypothetical protein EHF44_26655 [Cupriavidus pauculus]